MRIKIKYPNTTIGIRNAIQHKDSINSCYSSVTQPFPHAEIIVMVEYTVLYYNK
jgi:hypothetical protein